MLDLHGGSKAKTHAHKTVNEDDYFIQSDKRLIKLVSLLKGGDVNYSSP